MAKGKTMQWPKERQHNGQRKDNTMAKGKTTQWPKEKQHNGQRKDNTMAKGKATQWPKERQHNGQREKKNRTNNDIQNITQLNKKIIEQYKPH
jgi:hypothetical protein